MGCEQGGYVGCECGGDGAGKGEKRACYEGMDSQSSKSPREKSEKEGHREVDDTVESRSNCTSRGDGAGELQGGLGVAVVLLEDTVGHREA